MRQERFERNGDQEQAGAIAIMGLGIFKDNPMAMKEWRPPAKAERRLLEVRFFNQSQRMRLGLRIPLIRQANTPVFQARIGLFDRLAP